MRVIVNTLIMLSPYQPWKQLSMKALCLPGINQVGAFVYRQVYRLPPPEPFKVFPAKGELQVNYSHHNRFIMWNDGYDTVSAKAHFFGIAGFEPETINYLLAEQESCQVFFDVGANTGIYSLLAATFPHIRQVHAFEPIPEVMEYLQHSSSKNNFCERIMINTMAVGKQNGELTLSIPHSVIVPTSASLNHEFRSNTYERKVTVVTLDQYCKEHNIDRIDLIKIDTESTELDVLAGAQAVLSHLKPKLICEVLQSAIGVEISKFLADFGYRPYPLAGESARPIDFAKYQGKFGNFVFAAI